MFGRIMPREGRFFDLFVRHAEQVVLGARELVTVMSQQEPGPEPAQRIDDAEKRADKITHETIRLLHETFVTPLDRDSIHQLITRMDDILDLTQDTAESMTLYDIRTVTPECARLANICLSCCERVKAAVELLPQSDAAEAIMKTCQEIDRLESDADRVMRAAMSKLFREEQDVRQLIKLKAIYELLENITDRCEDVANIIEGIAIENS
jgi:predicted phosphate transport protein (TIGR00153 family)